MADSGSPTPAEHVDISEFAAWLRRLSEAFVSEGRFAVGFKAAADGLEELGRLRAIVTQLADIHHSDGQRNPWCDHDGFAWPCPTRRVLDEAREAIYTNPAEMGEGE